MVLLTMLEIFGTVAHVRDGGTDLEGGSIVKSASQSTFGKI